MKYRYVREIRRLDDRIEALRQSRLDATGMTRDVLNEQIDRLLDERRFYMGQRENS